MRFALNFPFVSDFANFSNAFLNLLTFDFEISNCPRPFTAHISLRISLISLSLKLLILNPAYTESSLILNSIGIFFFRSISISCPPKIGTESPILNLSLLPNSKVCFTGSVFVITRLMVLLALLPLALKVFT